MSPMKFLLMLLGGLEEDQNAGDVMGGGTSSVENLGVMGDFGHSNVVDEDLNMQPDQNKGDVMGGGTSGVENVGVVADFGHSNILDESDIGIETEYV